MLNASGKVVFTKVELEALGLQGGELVGLQTDGYVKIEGRRGRPAVAYQADSVKGVVEARRKFRKEAVEAAMRALNVEE